MGAERSRQVDARINDRPNVTIRDLFAVPVAVCHWPGRERLNAQLRAAIMTRYETSPGVVNSNRKGWHSEFDLHTWPEPCIQEFVEMIKSGATEMMAHMLPDSAFADGWKIQIAWANVNPPGGHNRSHNHLDEGAHLSGFYYVDIGECESQAHSGRTVFEDRSGVAQPSPAGIDPLSREYALVPRPGTMALFPASQFHYVEPYRGKGVRITIAFNLYHPDFTVLYYPGMRDEGWWWTNFRGLMILKQKIPEKMRALSLFAAYTARELRAPHSKASFSARLKVLYERASVDASAEKDAAGTIAAADNPNVKKRSLV